MKDAWLLFVSFGNGMQNRRFTNKFSGNGRFMTFSVDPRKELDGLFYDYVSVGYDGQRRGKEGEEMKILLFARPTTGSQYLFCGQCKAVGEEAGSGSIDLLLELNDFDVMESTAYTDFVA
jgi:hypothetical protein